MKRRDAVVSYLEQAEQQFGIKAVLFFPVISRPDLAMPLVVDTILEDGLISTEGVIYSLEYPYAPIDEEIANKLRAKNSGIILNG